MRELAKQGLLHASKDLSNGGIIGTTLLMLEYAQKGATINLEALPRPADITLNTWLKMYISTGFVVAAIPKNTQAIVRTFQDHGLSASPVGTVNDTRKLVLKHGQEQSTVFDFSKESIVAPPEPPQLNRLRTTDLNHK